MKILTIDDKGCNFLIGSKEIKPEALSKSNLLTLFNDIYQLDDVATIEFPSEDEIDKVKNLVEKEIINQIIQKVIEFVENLDQIKKDIESSFPILPTEE